MSSVLNTGLSFWQVTLLLLIAIIGTIAVKITFNLDINRFMENKQKSRSQRIKNICPHFEMIPLDNNQVEVRSLFIKPPMTLQHQCKKCGLVVYLDMEQHERKANFYLQNPNEYTKALDKFNKLLKKMGQI